MKISKLLAGGLPRKGICIMRRLESVEEKGQFPRAMEGAGTHSGTCSQSHLPQPPGFWSSRGQRSACSRRVKLSHHLHNTR